MSDEAQDTPVAATKSLFGALAFIFLLLGAEMIAEKDGTRWIPGVALIICGISSTYAAVFWNFVRTKLPKGAAIKINAIATSPRWWLALILVTLSIIIFMPVIEHPRWPSWPKTTLSMIPTSLKLQFNARGSTPQQIGKQNVEWTYVMPIETRQTGKKEEKICVPKPPVGLSGGGNFSFGQPPTSLSIVPEEVCKSTEIPIYTDTSNWIIVFAFPTEIAAKEIKVNTFGANIPKWDVGGLSNHGGYIFFHGDLTRVILEFSVVN